MILNYEWNSLYINGVTVELPAAIEKIRILNDRIILLLDNNEGKILDTESFDKSRNGFCLDLKGNILWQIEKPRSENDCYCNIYIYNDKSFKAVSCKGITYDLDPETGKISNPVFTK